MMEPRLGGGGSSCRANAQPGAGPAPNVARCPFPDNASSSRPANECQASNWNENPGDRFDNAADYSQLLRSFGELAAELVDLGFCCLLAQSFDSAALGLDNLICRAAEPGGHFRRLAEQVGPRCVLRELEALARQELTANAPVALLAPESLQFARTKILENYLQGQIQDMKNLFNLNRLTIDRSILLLLSASKCCLRGARECLRGLEARQSIVGQLRASISIIMAVVKLAIFGVQPEPGHLQSQHPNQHQPTAFSQLPSNFSTNPRPTLSLNLDLELDFESDFDFKQLFINRQLEPSAGLPIDFQPAPELRDFEPEPETERDHSEALGDACASKSRASLALAKLSRFQRTLKWKQQIMDFFLLSSGSKISAHDAIDRLQLLMEPFSRVASHKALTGALNDTFEMFRWLNEHALNDRPEPSEAGSDEPMPAAWPAPAATGESFLGDPAANRQVINEEADVWSGFADPPNSVAGPAADRAGELNAPNASSLGPHDGLAPTRAGSETPDAMVMDKRQLIDALTATFLGRLRASLVERVQEFTDCAYTKHESREKIIQLVQCVKLQLNKLVKLLYRMRRRQASTNEMNLALLRHLAVQFDETCTELKLELQSVVIEQSDELDRANLELDIVKQLKQQTLIGDCAKTSLVYRRFQEQNERLVELCKMLNQVAAANKMKMTTKSLAIWFELNTPQLLASAACLSQEPRLKVLKDHLWAYIQVWCSFYDDFCQLARQTAYLNHRQQDCSRANRISLLRHQVRIRNQRGLANFSPNFEHPAEVSATHSRLAHANAGLSLSQPIESVSFAIERADSRASLAGPNANYWQARRPEPSSESPRSLDHYYGFGSNYHQILGRSEEIAASANPQPEVASGYLSSSSQQQQQHYQQGRQQHAPTTASIDEDARQARLVLGARPLEHRPPLVQSGPNWPVVQPEPGAAATNPSPQMNFQRPAANVERRPNPIGGQVQLDEASFAHQVASRQPAPSVASQSSAERRGVTIDSGSPIVMNQEELSRAAAAKSRARRREPVAESTPAVGPEWSDPVDQFEPDEDPNGGPQSSDSEADAIVRGAKETAQMASSMYQFIRGEGDLNTTQDLFTQAELFAEEANELYKEVRCFSYKVPSGDLKRDLLSQLSTIPALVQQLQFVVKSPTVGNAATFAKVDSIIRETRSLMEAVNRVVNATMSCRQQYNMTVASRKRTRTLSPAYRSERGSLEFDGFSSRQSGAMGRQVGAGAGMGSEPDI